MTDRRELIDRIWERDPTVWTGADEAKWLGWLDEPRRMGERVVKTFVHPEGKHRVLIVQRTNGIIPTEQSMIFLT